MMSSGRRAKIRAPRKNFQKDVAFDDLWPKLALSIEQIHDENASQLSFEELYRTAYTLVLRKNGERLYNAVTEKIRELLTSVVEESFGSRLQLIQSSSIPSENLRLDVLKTLQHVWTDHCVCMRMISDILMYLDRAYSRETNLPLIYDAGVMIFRDTVLRSSKFAVCGFVYDTIIHEFRRERDGEAIDRITIKPILTMLTILPENRLEGESLYTAEFETLYIDAAEDYFNNAASKLLESTNDSFVYLTKINEWIEAESLRCGIYLPVTTRYKLMPKVEKVLITDRIDSVMMNPDSGFKAWVDNCAYDKLQLLYQTFAYVDKNYYVLQDHMKERIIEFGSQINVKAESLVNEAKAAKQSRNKEKSASLSPTAISIKWVEDILTLKEKMDSILENSFSGDVNIEKAAQSGFTEFLNKNSRAAEFLSLFIDDNLKKSPKGKTEAEVEELLNKSVLLFRFITDKDLFESYYKAHLAKRLLNGKSVSSEAEMNMVAKLKMEMGTAFTSKLEGMFRDMRISRDMLSTYKTFKNNDTSQQLSPIDLNVNVLTSTNWPTSVVSSQVKCIFPQELEQAKKSFESFYFSKHNGRLLSWNPSLGTVDVKIRFKKRSHEVNMPTLTYVVMTLFSKLPENGYLTYDQIKEASGLPTNELLRHLQSVAIAPRTRLLKKEPMSREISPTDKFYFNDSFESSMVRIKVLAVSSSSRVENDSEKKETMEKLNEARRYEIEAAIVRIMKARKTMEHAHLLGDVSKQLMKRFRPDPSQIKQRIDALIEREYLERSPDNRSVYNYLA